jgi:hypothetical protein
VAAETFREWHNAVGLVWQKADLTPATPLVRFGLKAVSNSGPRGNES